MEINSDTDNSNTMKEITSVIGIWLCKVCILEHGEHALTSHNIPKQIMISPWAKAKLDTKLAFVCFSHQNTFILSNTKCLLSIYFDLSTVLSTIPSENILWCWYIFAQSRAFQVGKRKKGVSNPLKPQIISWGFQECQLRVYKSKKRD